MTYLSEVSQLRSVTKLVTGDGQILYIRTGDFKKHPLKPGEEFDWDAYCSRIAAAQFNAAYESALSMLDASARSEKRMRTALIHKGYILPAVDAVIEKLKEAKLIDDTALADRYVSQASRAPLGVYEVRRKLLSKGIDAETAEQVLAALDDEQQVKAAVEAGGKYLRKYEDLPPYECRRKLSAALARRGFQWDVIFQAIPQLLGGDEFDDE